jgi:2-polyprenyl-3-methyl-5-hydroxy-6-metoxy-1,4-benzoquinol methylase
MDVRGHWESVYASKSDAEVSWTEPEPERSLALIAAVAPVPGARVIDVGGGASPLAGRLLDKGFAVTVLDVSESALERSRERLGARGADVRWVVGDLTDAPADLGTFDVWHDRAVFHFLIDSAARAAYVATLARSVRLGGHVVIATFAPDGPERCSGLPVRRYHGRALAAELGARFTLLKTVPHTHVTPWGKPQSFQYSLFQRA